MKKTQTRSKRKNRGSDSISLMKSKAWKEFSLYIRRKDMVNGQSKCVTCGDWKPYKEIHAGHFIAGRGNSILFDERGVHPQCYMCNIHKHGNLLEYYDFMEQKFGKEIIAEMRILAKQPKQMKVEDYTEIYNKYKGLNEHPR